MSYPVTFNYHHTGIFVSDMERSIEWYDEFLGYKLVYRNIFDLPGQGPTDMCWLKHGNHYIELYQYKCNPFNGEPQRPMDMTKEYMGSLGVKHLCLYVCDGQLDGLSKFLEEKGAKFMVKDHEWTPEQCGKPTGCKVIYIFDPDGIPIEIQETFSPGEYFA